MSPQTQRYVAGFNLMAVLGAVLVVIKALGLTELSWLWVLSPWWIPMVAAVVLITVGVGLAVLGGFIAFVGAFLSGLRG